MGKHHNFVFGDWEQITERTNQEINAPEKLLAKPDGLKGQYEIPYLDALSVERGRLFEVMGWIEQEKVRRKNLLGTAAELAKTNIKWRAYYMSEQAKVRKKNLGSSEEEIRAILWDKFLKYRGKKKVYRLRNAPFKKSMDNMTNQKVLSQSVSKAGLMWPTGEEEDTPVDIVKKKIEGLSGCAKGLGKKIEGVENGKTVEELKRQLAKEIEEDYGICCPDDVERAMEDIKARVMSYLEVDPCAHLGKKKAR